jgi:hypothetical protein
MRAKRGQATFFLGLIASSNPSGAPFGDEGQEVLTPALNSAPGLLHRSTVKEHFSKAY